MGLFRREGLFPSLLGENAGNPQRCGALSGEAILSVQPFLG